MKPDTTSSLNQPINLILLYCGVRTGHYGAGSHIGTLIPFLKEQPGIKITIIKTDAQHATEVSLVEEDGIEVLTIPQPENKLFLTTEDHLIQKTYARRIADVMYPYIYNKPNLVFWINSIDYLNICYLLKETFEHCKLMYVHHAWSWKRHINVSDETFAKKWRAGEKNFHTRAFEFNSYQQAIAKTVDHVVTVTDQARNFFINILDIEPDKLTTIYNGIVIPQINDANKNILRKKYGFTPEEKIILFTGRIKEEKGLHFLMKAFTKVAYEQENVKLIIAGKGDFAEFIPLAAPHWSKVVFTGELSAEQIKELYIVSDIGVLPSLQEQCSFTAIEMRFHKLPIIVSSVDGLDEMFVDGEDAMKLKVYFDDNGIKYLKEAELAEKLIFLLKNNNYAKKIIARSYNKALRLFTSRPMQESYLKVINQLAMGLVINNKSK